MELANRNKDNTIVLPVPLFGRAENPWHNGVDCKIKPYNSITIPFIQFDWPIPIPYSTIRSMYRAIKESDVVHIWTFFYLSSWIAMCMGSFMNKKVIMSCDTFPGITFKSGAIDYLFKAYYLLFGWTFKIPDKIHVYTEELAVVAKRFGIKAVVIPTGIHVSKFNPHNKKNKVFKVMFAGILSKRKGADRLMSLIKYKPFCEFHIYGEGPYYNKYKREYSSETVQFHGWSQDIPKDLARSDVLVLLSRGEGLPGIVMEAMASGLPVIATQPSDCLVDHNDTGIIVNDSSHATMWLGHLINNRNMAKQMGKRGLKKIQAYDWKKIYKKYEVLLYD